MQSCRAEDWQAKAGSFSQAFWSFSRLFGQWSLGPELGKVGDSTSFKMAASLFWLWCFWLTVRAFSLSLLSFLSFLSLGKNQRWKSCFLFIFSLFSLGDLTLSFLSYNIPSFLVLEDTQNLAFPKPRLPKTSPSQNLALLFWLVG